MQLTGFRAKPQRGAIMIVIWSGLRILTLETTELGPTRLYVEDSEIGSLVEFASHLQGLEAYEGEYINVQNFTQVHQYAL